MLLYINYIQILKGIHFKNNFEKHRFVMVTVILSLNFEIYYYNRTGNQVNANSRNCGNENGVSLALGSYPRKCLFCGLEGKVLIASNTGTR
jgi:hypothetical protein